MLFTSVFRKFLSLLYGMIVKGKGRILDENFIHLAYDI